jgi:hypothetical protein
MIFLLLISSLLFSQTVAFSVSVSYKTEQCFVVTAASSDSVTGSFEIITGEPKQIIIKVTGPPPIHFLHYESIYKSGPDADKDLSEGEFSFIANKAGDYKMCINSNNHYFEDRTPITVAFNFRTLTGEQNYKYKGLESELIDLRQSLNSLKDHESYMSQREDVHKATLDSINFKVICWSILEAIILISMAAWQITYISSFFETKRKL